MEGNQLAMVSHNYSALELLGLIRMIFYPLYSNIKSKLSLWELSSIAIKMKGLVLSEQTLVPEVFESYF